MAARRWHNATIDIVTASLIVFGLVLAAGALIGGGRWSPVLIVIGLVAALAGMTIGVHTHDWVTALDGPVASWINIRSEHHPRIYAAAEAVARIGNPATIAIAGVISGIALSVLDRSPVPGLVVVLTTGAAVLAKDVMVVLIERPVSASEFAASAVLSGGPNPFPSGHVAGTAALLGIAAVGIAAHGGSALRIVLASCVLTATLIVALSRLILEAHWFSDVVGGALLAGIAVTIGGAVMTATARIRRQRVPARPEIAARRRLRI